MTRMLSRRRVYKPPRRSRQPVPTITPVPSLPLPPPAVASPPLPPSLPVSRDALGNYLTALGILGEGVEIGVFRGEFSEKLLHEWRGKRLWMVDCWESQGADDPTDLRFDPAARLPDVEHQDNMAAARRATNQFGTRAVVLRKYSAEAAADFPDAYFDFVYIDGRHDYEGVSIDLRAWYPKLRAGGVFSGHDYFDGMRYPQGKFEVKRAVDEFANECGVSVKVIDAAGDWPTWLWIKK